MENLRITTIQSFIHWQNMEANLAHFEHQIAPVRKQTDLVILPEMFTTGFSMNPSKLAEPMTGKTMQWMTQQAAKTNAVITGSFIAEAGGKYYNRLIWMFPDGTFEQYDKRHLFTLAKEHENYEAGSKKLIVEWKGWKICPLICYDLRFPVWSRNVEEYDLLLYVANWPVTRSTAWKVLLEARAIENQCYVVGVNRVGEDGSGIQYSGDSSVIDCSGKILNRSTEIQQIATVEISHNEMMDFRRKLNFLGDRDSFSIED